MPNTIVEPKSNTVDPIVNPTSNPNPTAKKILLIDDEKPLTTALELKLKLTKPGFNVTTVYDGESGLKILKTQSFDLILLDLVMPGIDGYAILDYLKATKNTTPVIVLSNLRQEVDVKRVMEYGALEYFVKSDKSISEVVKYVKTVLSK